MVGPVLCVLLHSFAFICIHVIGRRGGRTETKVSARLEVLAIFADESHAEEREYKALIR